ncbi:MAG: DUF2955 domain-containing protein [Cetobacterium sp.]|uniref:DUF2955 domain-containing protein n=1 Tax=Cetobacterium sp. TaxID=2071632 RepID=UPI003EE57DC5
MCIKDYSKDILRTIFAITIGLLISKYTNLSFNFQIPVVAFGVVTSMTYFSLKIFLKNYLWTGIFATIGLSVSEIFRDKFLLFSLATFIFFFTCFFLSSRYQNAVRSGILGYSFTTIYSTYSDKIVENMVTDIFTVTFIGGMIGCLLLYIFPKKKEEYKISAITSNENIHPSFLTALKITIIVFTIWILYMIFDIRDTFFAYATLAGIYTNLNLDKIHKLSFLNIFIHVLGCTIAIIFSFLINGIGNNPIIFSLGIMLFFYPLIYLGYYGDTPYKRGFYFGVVRATILPICLYLSPYGDIVTKASSRAIQITIMLLFSMLLTRLILFIEGDSNE